MSLMVGLGVGDGVGVSVGVGVAVGKGVNVGKGVYVGCAVGVAGLSDEKSHATTRNTIKSNPANLSKLFFFTLTSLRV